MFIEDKAQKKVAFIENKVIIHLDTGSVLGIVLGNCVYNNKGFWVGKHFDSLFRNKNGFITGKVTDNYTSPPAHHITYSPEAAWNIIGLIHGHPCDWVPAFEQWDKNDFLYYMQEEAPVMALS